MSPKRIEPIFWDALCQCREEGVEGARQLLHKVVTSSGVLIDDYAEFLRMPESPLTDAIKAKMITLQLEGE